METLPGPAEHKTPYARLDLVQLQSQSAFSRAQHPVTQAVSFPVTAPYFLVKDLYSPVSMAPGQGRPEPAANPLQLFWKGTRLPGQLRGGQCKCAWVHGCMGE